MKREIIFGIGGGIVCYQLGICKFLIENFDNNFLRENYYFGGASAGSISSLILCSVLHGVDSIDIWFNNLILKLILRISKLKTGALFKLNNLIPDIIDEGYQKILQNNKNNLFLNDKYHLVVSQFPKLNKKVIHNFGCSKQLVDGLSASCNAPLLNKNIFIDLNSSFCTDGIFCNKIPSRYNESQKIYFSIFDQKEKNCKTINIFKWGTLNLSDLWLWGDIDLAKKLYFNGYQDCYNNFDLLKRHILFENSKLNIFYSKLFYDINNQVSLFKNNKNILD